MKISEATEETLRLGDSTHPWIPKARLRELGSKGVGSNNTTNIHTKSKRSFKHLAEELGYSIPIRIDLISSPSQTEFNISPGIFAANSVEGGIKQFEEKTNQASISGATPVMLAVSCTEKWKGKGGKAKNVGGHCSETNFLNKKIAGCSGGVGAPGSLSSRGKDCDSRNWTLEADLHSVFLRFSLIFENINKIPRNHLRYYYLILYFD